MKKSNYISVVFAITVLYPPVPIAPAYGDPNSSGPVWYMQNAKWDSTYWKLLWNKTSTSTCRSWTKVGYYLKGHLGVKVFNGSTPVSNLIEVGSWLNDQSGLRSTTWTCSEENVTGTYIKVEIWYKFEGCSWTNTNIAFKTETFTQNTILNATTWTISLYGAYTMEWGPLSPEFDNKCSIRFCWGSSNRQSRIKNMVVYWVRRWTIMVYMAADTSSAMDTAATDHSINEMEEVGSTSDITVFAQADYFAFESGVVKRYLVTKDNDSETITSQVLWSQDEINMGVPQTLVDFVNNSTQYFPAEHYALILWNHGFGFRGVCYDDDPSDELNMTEVESALSEIESETGITFDLIGFDACLMGELEVAYEIKNYTQVMVGHEETGHITMWPYDYILSNLTYNPTMSTTELAKKIVTNYAGYHTSNPDALPKATISAVDMANITELSLYVNSTATALQQNLQEYRDIINSCRRNVTEYGHNTTVNYVDTYHFFELLNQTINNNTVKNLCQQIIQAVNATIISEWHRPDGPRPNAHGITIYFPDDKNQWDTRYDGIKYSEKNQWDEFLKDYLEIPE